MQIKERFSELKEWIVDNFPFQNEKEEHTIGEAEDIAEIPEEYSRRFTLESLHDFKQVLYREEEFKALEKCFTIWQQTKNPLLCVGEFGSGLTSLLNGSLSHYPDALIIENDLNIRNHADILKLLKGYLQIPNARTLQDLADQIDTENPRVIIFENIERLFLRQVNGFKLLEDFILLMHATKSSIYWILTINKFTMYYLDRCIGFSANFSSIIRLPAFESESIKNIILQRNDGYEIVYLKPSNPSRLFKRRLNKAENSERKQELLATSFFNSLYQFSDGNISRSIMFWKRSVIRIKEKRVYVKAYESKPIGELGLQELFILEAILLHTSLSISELRSVLRNSGTASRLAIEKLLEKDLIFPRTYKDGEVEYQINILHLKALKNLIHSRLNRNIK